MSQRGKEVPEDMGDTAPPSLPQKGPTLKGTWSRNDPTTTRKTPKRGCFRGAGNITRGSPSRPASRGPSVEVVCRRPSAPWQGAGDSRAGVKDCHKAESALLAVSLCEMDLPCTSSVATQG